MAMWRRACLLGLLVVAPALCDAASVSPVRKVIQLLEGMADKGTSDKQAEAVQFAAYKSWCDSTTKEKQAAVASANEKMEDLVADIAKYQSDAEGLGEEVAGLDADVSTWQGDVVASGKVRDIENIDYVRTHKDYSESIEALASGVETLKKQNHDMAQTSSLLQRLKRAPLVTAKAKRAIDAFFKQDTEIGDVQGMKDENLAASAPEAAAFESQLQGVIDMLEGLAAKFEDERTSLEKSEAASKHSFEMLSMDLKQQIDAASEARTEKAESKADALQRAADAKGSLEDITSTRDDDDKYLSSLIATCELKSSAFADRQTVRAGELEAINKAIEILSGKSVSGASEKHLPQLLQMKGSSLAQLRSDTLSPAQSHVAEYLREQARRSGSRLLAMLANRATADPFKKVKKMVKDLIVKLMEQANNEVETKGFCDKEMQTNEHTRKDKTALVESLTANIDELQASLAMLTEEIATLSTELSELENAMSQAFSIRTSEKAKNAVTIKDAQDAQAAVSSALNVLRDFYESAATSTSLVQQPATFDKPYTGMSGESGGIVSMLEVIESDFLRLETETTAQDESAVKEYKDFVNESDVNKAQLSRDLDHKTEKKTSQEQALQETRMDLAGTEKELNAALEVYEKLKPTCVGGGAESFEDRAAQRKDEIESLQEALRILNGEDIA